MSEETLNTGSDVAAETATVGTTQEGQSNQSAANDPAAFQADYTQKYQALALERKQLEEERAAWNAQRAQQAPQPAYQQSYAQPQVNHSPEQELVDQFGHEAAQALMKLNSQTSTQHNQQLFQLAYSNEEMQGRLKYGDEWDTLYYNDPTTGQRRHKALDDYRLMQNAVTGKSMTLDEAWRLAKVSDLNAYEQQVKEKAYQEMQQKQNATPAAQTSQRPSAPATGHTKGVKGAFAAARAEHGVG